MKGNFWEKLLRVAGGFLMKEHKHKGAEQFMELMCFARGDRSIG